MYLFRHVPPRFRLLSHIPIHLYVTPLPSATPTVLPALLSLPYLLPPAEIPPLHCGLLNNNWTKNRAPLSFIDVWVTISSPLQEAKSPS